MFFRYLMISNENAYHSNAYFHELYTPNNPSESCATIAK